MNAFFKFIMLVIIGMNVMSVSAQTGDPPKVNPKHHENELNALNAFLADFDDGFFGYIEIVDGQIQIRFRDGKFSKFHLENMMEPELNETYGQVSWNCKDDGPCVTTDWSEDGKETGILFSGSGPADLEYLMELLNGFIKAYGNK